MRLAGRECHQRPARAGQGRPRRGREPAARPSRAPCSVREAISRKEGDAAHHQQPRQPAGRRLHRCRASTCSRSSAIGFLDEAAAQGPQHLLDTLISSKKKDLKKLTIFGQRRGRAQLLVSYIVECAGLEDLVPPAARRPQGQRAARAAAAAGLGAGSTTPRTRTGTTSPLSLVAGLPISFVHDLYSPRYKTRPHRQGAARRRPMRRRSSRARCDDLAATDAERHRPDSARGPWRAAATPASPPPPPACRPDDRRPRCARQAARSQSAPVQTRTVESRRPVPVRDREPGHREARPVRRWSRSCRRPSRAGGSRSTTRRSAPRTRCPRCCSSNSDRRHARGRPGHGARGRAPMSASRCWRRSSRARSGWFRSRSSSAAP